MYDPVILNCEHNLKFCKNCFDEESKFQYPELYQENGRLEVSCKNCEIKGGKLKVGHSLVKHFMEHFNQLKFRFEDSGEELNSKDAFEKAQKFLTCKVCSSDELFFDVKMYGYHLLTDCQDM